jgi:hypothetical protein
MFDSDNYVLTNEEGKEILEKLTTDRKLLFIEIPQSDKSKRLVNPNRITKIFKVK